MFRSSFEFGTKAETLDRLRHVLEKSSVPASFSFCVESWTQDRKAILDSIQAEFSDKALIVRSSCQAEDGAQSAHAGAFLSLPDIPSQSRPALTDAIDEVIRSYQKGTTEPSPNDQVLVQEMVSDVAMSGVVFTQDMSTGAPYYVVNYDDESGTTDTITSGHYNNRTLYVFRDAVGDISSVRFQALFAAIQEIEAAVSDDCIDIEFALDRAGNVILFQVRQITSQPNWNRGLTLRIRDELKRSAEFVQSRYGYARGKQGSGLDAVLGNMPDWNPAEIIGTAPRRLAFSLYRYLITDSIWRIARGKMGYRERPGRPLMVALSGQPMIDVRESFYSYIPEDVDSEVADKLVASWLSRLRENHHLHDKVEFAIATTCYSFDFEDRVREQFPDALTAEELTTYKAHLKAQTDKLVKGELAQIRQQLSIVDGLATRYQDHMSGQTDPSLELLSLLLEDAIKCGTLPFSILARHGFVATSLLKSLVASGALSQQQAEAFLRSVPTVASDFLRDVLLLQHGKLQEYGFFQKYGHLRPGTYDILSLRYDQRKSAFDANSFPQKEESRSHSFSVPEGQSDKIQALIEDHGLTFSVDQLFDYMREAIQAREYAKFIFTKNLSAALELIAAWGKNHGLSRDELSHLDVRDILDCQVCPAGRSLESHLREKSLAGEQAYMVTTAVRLPFLITELSDLSVIPLAVDSPNFITRKNVDGEVVVVGGEDCDPAILDNRIVVIESADPGFDWIFSRPILGLVTKFGGANSHMAVRCAEFDIPAAIGCGEQIFQRVTKSSEIELRCAEGQVKFVQEQYS